MGCLVIGGGGFAGRAIARRLEDAGIETRTLVRRATDRRQNERIGSIADPASIVAAAEPGWSLIHAAGTPSPRAPKEVSGWVDVAGTENVVKAARVLRSERLIYISCTGATAFHGERVGWNEDAFPPGGPIGSWAKHRLLAEDLVRVQSFQPGGLVLRAGLLWGPGDMRRVSWWCREGLKRGLRLVGDGRHFIATTYIDNLTEAALLALKANDVGVFHICDRELVLARDFFTQVAEALQCRPPRHGMPPRFALSFARLKWWAGLGAQHHEELLHTAFSTSLDTQRGLAALGDYQGVDISEGMSRLSAWVGMQGGAVALARHRPTYPSLDDISAQRDLAQAGQLE